MWCGARKSETVHNNVSFFHARKEELWSIIKNKK